MFDGLLIEGMMKARGQTVLFFILWHIQLIPDIVVDNSLSECIYQRHGGNQVGFASASCVLLGWPCI